MNALTPWRTRPAPWPELEEMENRMNRIFRSFGKGEAETGAWLPAIDLKEAENEYTLTAEVPGVPAKDIQMEVEDNILTLKGEKHSEREETKGKNGRWHMVERSYGAFERSLTLPAGVDSSAIKADCADGVLTIHMPKRAESTPRRISIDEKK